MKNEITKTIPLTEMNDFLDEFHVFTIDLDLDI